MVDYREFLKTVASYVPTTLTETIGNYAAVRECKALLPPEYVVRDRAMYFRRIAEVLGGSDVRLLFLEFGVWRGESLRQWTTLNRNPKSRFYGFDSFAGLPEQWRSRPAGHFNLNGEAPRFEDPRVVLVPGWFNQTLAETFGSMDVDDGATVLVHIDADLYSSALYCLGFFAGRLERFHVMFDEFGAGEGRALRDVCVAWGAGFKPILGLKRTRHSTIPTRVFGEFVCAAGGGKPRMEKHSGTEPGPDASRHRGGR